jgi:hypothetical protein
MIFINPLSNKIISARNEHFEKLSILLKKRLISLKFTTYQKSFLLNSILPNLEIILIGNPMELKRFSNSVVLTKSKKTAILKLFNYSIWFIEKTEKRYCAYDLAKNIDINTCVYCNRNYTSTVEKITRPQFDHYFSQTRDPLLALSFFNLIPSCSICNSGIKGKKELVLRTHLHPYLDNILSDVMFSYRLNNKMKGALEVKLKETTNRKVSNSLKFFKIEEVYNAHNDELRDLIKIRETFSDNYLEILAGSVLAGTKISKNELYQFAFGVYKDEDKLSLRPFSKFKKDILTELGII